MPFARALRFPHPGIAVTLHMPGADLGRCTAAAAALLPDGSPAQGL
ncbi:hypothetical protein [Catellatospora sichuanensis]|nr:hypothetical protein [Catellatospora sichuanensis]